MYGLIVPVAIGITIAVAWYTSKKKNPPTRTVAPRPKVVQTITPRPPSHENDDGMKIVKRPIPALSIDLRDNAELEFTIVGQGHWVHPRTVQRYPMRVFYLRRERDNKHDANAIAVYGGERKFGYLAATAAAQYAPLLDQIGTDFAVQRNFKYYAGDKFFLPRIPVLRKSVEQQKPKIYGPGQEDLDPGGPRVSRKTPGKKLTGGYPPIGTIHKNGDRIYGYSTGYASALMAAGTPAISTLNRRSITPAIEGVRIGDKLQLRREKNVLVVEKLGERIGTLNWGEENHFFDGGTMEVQRVFISAEARIVNCAGIAVAPD